MKVFKDFSHNFPFHPKFGAGMSIFHSANFFYFFFSRTKETRLPVERKLLHQMSSGFGTQQNNSKDEPTITESMELQTIGPINSLDTDPMIQLTESQNADEFQYQKSMLTQSPSYRISVDSENINRTTTASMKSFEKSPLSMRYPQTNHERFLEPKYIKQTSLDERKLISNSGVSSIRSFRRTPSYHKSMNRLPSDLSINTMSIEQDDILNHSNLRDELLNCEQKELFQFLSDDFDTSNNYFSDTIGFSSNVIDDDTESLILDTKEKCEIFSPVRKTSNGSLKSNFSNISNSIFQKLEGRRGGSIAGSVDKLFNKTDLENKLKRLSDPLSYSEYDKTDKLPLVGNSEFDEIIHSFDKELSELKSATSTLNRRNLLNLRTSDQELLDKLSTINTPKVVRRSKSNQIPATIESIKIKRRSLEKQKKVSDDDFNMMSEIKKISEQLQAPFNESMNQVLTSPRMRRKDDFHSSFDRIKRISLIDRVEECNENELIKVESERLPRKTFSIDANLDTMSLKSIGSNENLEKKIDLRSRIHLDEQKLMDELNKSLQSFKNKEDNAQNEDTEKVKSILTKKEKTKPLHTLVSYVDDITVGGRRNSKGVFVDPTSFPSFGDQKPSKIPQDCFPQKCYEKMACWDNCIVTEMGQFWMKVRTAVLSVVDTPAFEWFVLVLIFASSITLCFEDIHLDANLPLKQILYWTNFAFCLIFTIEMILKWIGFGLAKYFSSFWTILDFIIVFVSVFSLLIEENENLKVLRSLRTLRALRPLRAISRWQGMRIVVNALMYAIPSIFNVLLVCLVFWLIFSIMGVQFFGGKFFKCVDEEGELLPIEVCILFVVLFTFIANFNNNCFRSLMICNNVLI